MYKERKKTNCKPVHAASRCCRGGNRGVWKPPAEKYIHITPINTTGAGVTTLLLPPASVQSHCAGFNQAAM